MNPTEVVQASIDTWNDADRQAFLACYADDCEIVAPGLAGSGHEGVAAFWAANMTPMPDARVTVLRLVADGDTVAEEATAHGTNTGPSWGPDGSEVPPTGRTMTLGFGAVHTVRGERIVSSHFYWDQMTLLGQLGLLPEPAAGA